jgi:hypothetical protein
MTNEIQKKATAVFFSALLATATLGLTGCDDGPAENMGEEIDNAVDEVENAIE